MAACLADGVPAGTDPQCCDSVEYSNLGKSVIVVRTNSGVKAFHNTCRHRGVQLASGHGNCRLQASSVRSTAGPIAWMAEYVRLWP